MGSRHVECAFRVSMSIVESAVELTAHDSRLSLVTVRTCGLRPREYRGAPLFYRIYRSCRSRGDPLDWRRLVARQSALESVGTVTVGIVAQEFPARGAKDRIEQQTQQTVAAAAAAAAANAMD